MFTRRRHRVDSSFVFRETPDDQTDWVKESIIVSSWHWWPISPGEERNGFVIHSMLSLDFSQPVLLGLVVAQRLKPSCKRCHLLRGQPRLSIAIFKVVWQRHDTSMSSELGKVGKGEEEKDQ